MPDDLNLYYLKQMGIDCWTQRHQDDTSATIPTLTSLNASVVGCKKCPLHRSRQQTVFARGNANAKLMIIGEAPGAQEDKVGLPFIGRAGQLLTQMLQSIGLNDEHAYIANVIKCRPPDNRAPKNDEIDQCSPYLAQQIAIVAPKLIVALGRFASQFVMQKTLPIKQLRQQCHFYQTIPCYISYHPAYLLRNPADKKKSYQDLIMIKKHLATL